MTALNIQSVLSPNCFNGRDGYKPSWVILHGTAGGSSALNIANFFSDPASQVSSNYVVGLAGEIIRCVDESDGAWGNGPISGPPGVGGDGIHHDSWWDTAAPNPNYVTISIEHVKLHDDNSDTLTPAQQASSFALILDICKRNGIPMRAADASGGITGHFSMDPVSRSRCPGTYPWAALWAYLGGTGMNLPTGWSDDGTTLKYGPYVVVRGFRDHVLAGLQDGSWRADDIPYENEHAANPLEYSNPVLKPGTKQRCRYTTLEWNNDKGVFVAYTGPELIKLEQLVVQQAAQIASMSKPANIAQVSQSLATIETAVGVARAAIGQQ